MYRKTNQILRPSLNWDAISSISRRKYNRERNSFIGESNIFSETWHVGAEYLDRDFEYVDNTFKEGEGI